MWFHRIFIFKLMNNLLPSYFDIFKPMLGIVCSFYDISKPLFSLLKPTTERQKSSLKYIIPKLLNEENGCISITCTSKVHTYNFQNYKKGSPPHNTLYIKHIH